MYLPALSDDEIVRHALNAYSPLTSTELEVELANRFSALLGRYAGIDEAVGEAGLDGPDHAAELVACLSAADVLDKDELSARLELSGIAQELLEDADPESLRTALTRANEFSAIADDASEVFARLNTLISTTATC